MNVDWGAALNTLAPVEFTNRMLVAQQQAGLTIDDPKFVSDRPAYLPMDVWSEAEEQRRFNEEMFAEQNEMRRTANEDAAEGVATSMIRAQEAARAARAAQGLPAVELVSGERFAGEAQAPAQSGSAAQMRMVEESQRGPQFAENPKFPSSVEDWSAQEAKRLGLLAPAPRSDGQGASAGSAAQRRMVEEQQYYAGMPPQMRAQAAAQRAKEERYARWAQLRKDTLANMAGSAQNYYMPSGFDYEAQTLPFVTADKAKQFGITEGWQAPEYSVDNQNLSDSMMSARTQLDTMTPEQLAEFRAKGRAKGLYNPNAPIMAGVAGPADVEVMGSLMAVTNATISPSWQVTLDQIVNPYTGGTGYESGGGYGSSGGGSGGGGPTNVTNKVYNKTSVDQGRGVLRSLMAEMLGRAPNDDEVRRYVSALNRKEAAEPQVVTTVYGSGGATVTSRTTSNAPEPDEVLREQVEQASPEEMQRYESGGYMNILNQMLGL